MAAVVIAGVAVLVLGSLMVASLGRAARDLDDLLKTPSDSQREKVRDAVGPPPNRMTGRAGDLA
jgi:hypothetical protein